MTIRSDLLFALLLWAGASGAAVLAVIALFKLEAIAC